MSDPASLKRNGRVLRALPQLVSYRRGLRSALAEFDGKDAWVARWVADRRGEDNAMAAVERQFERILNAWQDEIFDVIEAEAAAKGLVPEPSRSQDDALRWADEARAMDLIGPADDTQNRWGRQALMGVIAPATAARMGDLSKVRQLFQHAYTNASDAGKGGVVWDSIHDLLEIFPTLAENIDGALGRFWPEEPGAETVR